MTRTFTHGWVVAIAALLAALSASAQLFKCQGPDGKVVYSDQRCESKSTTSNVPGAANNANRPTLPVPGVEKAAAEKGVGATPGVTGEALPEVPVGAPMAATGEAKPAGLTSAQQDRIRDLQTTAARSGATAEQKAGAQLEMDSIRRGRESRLSSDDRSRRESLTVDLGSVDAKKRAAALRELRSLYY